MEPKYNGCATGNESENSDSSDDTSTHSDIQPMRIKITRKRKGEHATPHKVIEKRRRDRINRSLDELRAIIPAARKSQGMKNDKVDLLQMTIEYLKSFQPSLDFECSSGNHSEKENDDSNAGYPSSHKVKVSSPHQLSPTDVMMSGFKECAEEAIRYLIEEEHLPPDHPLVVRLSNHLKKVQTSFEFNAIMEHADIFSSRMDAPVMTSAPEMTHSRCFPSPDHHHTPSIVRGAPNTRTLPATSYGELRIDTGPVYTSSMSSHQQREHIIGRIPGIPPPQLGSACISPTATGTVSGTSVTPSASLTPLFAYVPRYAYSSVPPVYLASPPIITSPSAPQIHSSQSAAPLTAGNHSPYVMAYLSQNTQ
ncbi:hairy/enhancer-of-split related with YRPW motif protein 1-like isoform X2 [Saccoglossus kowalevskii]|uniref:Hairy/enhancer-of-split related with YRPW motif protein 2-like isoform X1 n=1 Tax=Saccoglossus kowalevskii TaxID=10224 RepID=A0ABM0GWB6_SACKO|nr:PREDICTED: hairy/enhancer-of-split related with YRPW motif protein 2-like isoform X1 [Saccoglossus kowalevskii]